MSIVPWVIQLPRWPACLPPSHSCWGGLWLLSSVPNTHKTVTCPICRESSTFPLIRTSFSKQLQSLLQSVPLSGETGLGNLRGDQYRERLLRQLRYKVWEQVFKQVVQAWVKLPLQHPSWAHVAKMDLGPVACIYISSVFPLRCSYSLAMQGSLSLSCIYMNYLHVCGLYCCPALKKFRFTIPRLKDCVFAFY